MINESTGTHLFKRRYNSHTDKHIHCVSIIFFLISTFVFLKTSSTTMFSLTLCQHIWPNDFILYQQFLFIIASKFPRGSVPLLSILIWNTPRESVPLWSILILNPPERKELFVDNVYLYLVYRITIFHYHTTEVKQFIWIKISVHLWVLV